MCSAGAQNECPEPWLRAAPPPPPPPTPRGMASPAHAHDSICEMRMSGAHVEQGARRVGARAAGGAWEIGWRGGLRARGTRRRAVARSPRAAARVEARGHEGR